MNEDSPDDKNWWEVHCMHVGSENYLADICWENVRMSCQVYIVALEQTHAIQRPPIYIKKFSNCFLIPSRGMHFLTNS